MGVWVSRCVPLVSGDSIAHDARVKRMPTHKSSRISFFILLIPFSCVLEYSNVNLGFGQGLMFFGGVDARRWFFVDWVAGRASPSPTDKWGNAKKNLVLDNLLGSFYNTVCCNQRIRRISSVDRAVDL